MSHVKTKYEEAIKDFDILVGGEELKEIIEYPPSGNWHNLYVNVKKALERAKKVEESLNKIIDELKQIEKLQDRNAKISKIIYGDYGLPKYQNIEHEQKQNEYTILYYPFIKIINQLEEELK